MRLLKSALIALFALALLLSGASHAQFLREGVNYEVLARASQTTPGPKVEVTEFFAYFCPHCYRLDPRLDTWVAAMGDRISFRRLHSAFGGKTLHQQRLFFALEAMGKLPDLHTKVFQAVHRERRGMNDEASNIEFAVRNGLDRAAFTEAYNSFAVVSKAQRTANLEAAYELDGVPNIVVDGRYLTGLGIVARALPRDVSEDQAQAYLLRVVDALVARAAAERR